MQGKAALRWLPVQALSQAWSLARITRASDTAALAEASQRTSGRQQQDLAAKTRLLKRESLLHIVQQKAMGREFLK